MGYWGLYHHEKLTVHVGQGDKNDPVEVIVRSKHLKEIPKGCTEVCYFFGTVEDAEKYGHSLAKKLKVKEPQGSRRRGKRGKQSRPNRLDK